MASALATTVGRERAAAKAGNTTALRLQQEHGLALLPKYVAALRGLTAANRALAAVLVTYHSDYTPDRAAWAFGLEEAVARLGKLRPTATQLAALRKQLAALPVRSLVAILEIRAA